MTATTTTRGVKTKKEEAIYDVTFKGVYYSDQPGIKHNYKITVKMTRDMIVNHGAQSVFSKHLARELMPKAGYTDFANLGTYHIIGCKQITGDKMRDHITMMTRQEMIDFARGYKDGEGMDIELSLYPTDDDLRTAITEYVNDSEGFIIRQQALIDKYGKLLDTRRAALALNAIDMDAINKFDPDNMDNVKDRPLNKNAPKDVELLKIKTTVDVGVDEEEDDEQAMINGEKAIEHNKEKTEQARKNAIKNAEEQKRKDRMKEAQEEEY